MSHLAKLGTLTDELVEAITSTSSKNDRARFHAFRESAFRSLRYHNFLRTNQFDVESQLLGLQERFTVHHREALADALKFRLELLDEAPSKWNPEILHFLLELADQPTQKTDLGDLELLREPDDDPGPILTWEDIAKEEGWDDDLEIWQSINYSDSSDDGYLSDATQESDTTALSVVDPSLTRRPEDIQVAPEDPAALAAVRESQAWRSPVDLKDKNPRPRKVPISEFQVTREVLFMLQGLQTSLFEADCAPNTTYQMKNVAWDTYRASIGWFAEAGRHLLVLRSFSTRVQTAPLLQVFHKNVESSLQDFDKQLAGIQSRITAPDKDTVVSLIAVQRELGLYLDPLNALSSLIRQLDETSHAAAFRYLELLFEMASVSQADGKAQTYDFLGRIFFDCFQVYLRPIRSWMQEGEPGPEDDIFFVSQSAADIPLHLLWQEKFKLRRSHAGRLHAPKFLAPSASAIFTAGKSIVVLKQLGKYESMRNQWDQLEPALTYDAVCPADRAIVPFSELFGSAFKSWIQSKHLATSEALKRVLFETCDLQANMQALEHVYFTSNGSMADTFAQHLFDRIDSCQADWHNRYLLTGLAQEAFSSQLDGRRVTVDVASETKKVPISLAQDTVRRLLPSIGVNYRLTWPVRLIVSEQTLVAYRAVSTFLLQIRRATHALNKRWAVHARASDKSNKAERAAFYNVRSSLVWFCTCLHAYLATIVLAPSANMLRRLMREAHDVDAMIEVHDAVIKQAIDAACLGSKLDPIRQVILDVLDLGLRLERLEAAQTKGDAKQTPESSSMPEAGTIPHDAEGDENDQSDTEGQPALPGTSSHQKSYIDSLREIKSDFNRHLRFICGGLRGVARASGDEAAAKWDMLAEMLETGIRVDVTSS